MSGKVSRRTVLGAGAGLIGTGLVGCLPSAVRASSKGKAPKNVIFLVADGMAASVPTMVDHLMQIQGKPSSYWRWLMRQPGVVNAHQDTRSLNSVVTDSSAASSTWGSGRFIWNGMLNMLPDLVPMKTLTMLMHGAGVKCGLVTTATMTHATPAGFTVSHWSRDEEAQIAEKYLADGTVDVFFGGGNKFFAADKRADKKDLYAGFEKAGFKVVKDRDAMMSVSGDKVLGIFSDSHIPYTVDRDNSPDLQKKVPTLAEMTTKALELLKGSSNGFLLQVEGARVDHGGHANDAAAMLFDQIAFEEAVKVAYEFAKNDGETLIVITADHATGGVALNGDGDEYIDATTGLKTLAGFKASYGPLGDALGKAPDASMCMDVFRAKLGVVLTATEGQLIADAVANKFPKTGNHFQQSKNAVFANVLANYTRVGFTSGNHTSDWVLLSAFGPGADQFNQGVVQNVDINGILLGFRGLKHNNPRMTFEEAAPLYHKLQNKAAMNHWLHDCDECC